MPFSPCNLSCRYKMRKFWNYYYFGKHFKIRWIDLIWKNICLISAIVQGSKQNHPEISISRRTESKFRFLQESQKDPALPEGSSLKQGPPEISNTRYIANQWCVGKSYSLYTTVVCKLLEIYSSCKLFKFISFNTQKWL